MIYLSGFNISAEQAIYYSGRGKLERVARGVYVKAGLSEKQKLQCVRDHAARVVAHLFPNDPLSAGSAYHQGAVGDRIFVARDAYRQPVEICGITIHFQAVKSKFGIPYDYAALRDDIGEIKIKVLTDEVIILQSFTKPRGVSAKKQVTDEKTIKPGVISIHDLASVVSRAIRKSGSLQHFTEKLEKVSKNMDMEVQYRHATQFINRISPEIQEKRFMNEYRIYFHGIHMADMRYDGREWDYRHRQGVVPLSLSEKTIDGSSVPYFMESIFPENGNIGRADEEAVNFSDLRKADRYLSNIVIRPSSTPKSSIILDVLEGGLDKWLSPRGEFTGSLAGMPSSFDDGLYTEIKQIQFDPDCPRMSGVQIKLPANLSEDGSLSPAIGKSFTHIVKMPAIDKFMSMGANEWYSMTLASLCGLKTEKFGITNIPGIGPSLIAERFDIRQYRADRDMLMAEDMCSIFGMERSGKYDKDLVHVAETLLLHSTNQVEDAHEFFRQTAFSWLIGNTDTHLKNIMLVKKVNRDMSAFESISLAPAYDILCGMIYTPHVDSGLKLGGKTLYALDEFRLLARSLGIKPANADKILREMTSMLDNGVEMISRNMPPAITEHIVATSKGEQRISMEHIKKINQIIDSRCAVLNHEISEKTKRKQRMSF